MSANCEKFDKDSMKTVDVDPPPCAVSEEVKLSVPSDGHQLRWLLLAMTCLSVALLMLLARNSMTSHPNSRVPDVVSIETKVRDPDGVDMTQHIFSSVVNNYVTYHVIKPSQQMWTLDDFENHVHIMKVETPHESVCYVTSLNRSHATSPQVYSARNTHKLLEDRRRSQTVLIAGDQPITDLESLGRRGMQLCKDVPVFTAYRLDANHSYQNSRSKRHVKKCVMSCCHLVCCCNQKYLHWQSADNFNCEHVCHGCTPASNTKIDRKC